MMTRGYASRSLVCGEFRISRQYDYDNGAWDQDIEDYQMRSVDFQVSEMQDPYRTAIHINAKCLTLGVYVFTSPRLPDNSADRRTLTNQARDLLVCRLVAAGVI
jgi:hypothetical protein